MRVLYWILTYLFYGAYVSTVWGGGGKNGQEHAFRYQEKLGITATERPAGNLVWFHAASVGECLSILKVVEQILVDIPTLNILVTTGTVTSARIVRTRFPQEVIHQFAPLDFPQSIDRFITHWKPDTCIWVESEIWPNMLSYVSSENIPVLLLNMRLSENSLSRWMWVPRTFMSLLARFKIILTQTRKLADTLRKLGLKNVGYVGNLKYVSSEDAGLHHRSRFVRDITAGRKPYFVASTHPGEEISIFTLHRVIREKIPQSLLIIAPRHPERADSIMQDARRLRLTSVKYSHFLAAQDASGGGADGQLRVNADVLVVDQIGVMSEFYQSSPVSVIGGSFSETVGGHNPIEAIHNGSLPIFGPHTKNFSEITEDVLRHDVGVQVENVDALEQHVISALMNANTFAEFFQKRSDFLASQEEVLLKVIDVVYQALPFVKYESRYKDVTKDAIKAKDGAKDDAQTSQEARKSSLDENT